MTVSLRPHIFIYKQPFSDGSPCLDETGMVNSMSFIIADVCETAGSRELAAQALLSMDSPNGPNESRTFLQSLVPNGDTSTTHNTQQSKTGWYYNALYGNGNL